MEFFETEDQVAQLASSRKKLYVVFGNSVYDLSGASGGSILQAVSKSSQIDTQECKAMMKKYKIGFVWTSKKSEARSQEIFVAFQTLPEQTKAVIRNNDSQSQSSIHFLQVPNNRKQKKTTLEPHRSNRFISQRWEKSKQNSSQSDQSINMNQCFEVNSQIKEQSIWMVNQQRYNNKSDLFNKRNEGNFDRSINEKKLDQRYDVGVKSQSMIMTISQIPKSLVNNGSPHCN